MRVYLPATLQLLARWARSRELPPGPACAVTPALRESYASGDTEELEWVASTRAARAALRLLDSEPGGPRRRVVLAVDAPDGAVRQAGPDCEALGGRPDEACVELVTALPWRHVAAVLSDDASAEPAVAAAVEALPGAAGGDPDSVALVEDAEGYPLSWYAAQEVGDLLGEAGIAEGEPR